MGCRTSSRKIHSVFPSTTMYLKTSFIVIVLFGICSGIPKKTSIADLEQYIRAVMKCRDVTGVSLSLVKGNKTVYTGGFGYRDLTTHAPLTETTLLNIGSESKAFTSILAADAVARKLVTWDEPLMEIFPPGFRLQDDFRSQKATLRDFLSHRLGMPSYWGVTTAVMNLTIMEIAEKLKDFPVLWGFRTKFLYSNYLFVVAGAAVQQATGETWPQGVYKHIFQPLNMTGSRVSTTLTEADWENMAYSNTVINNTHVQNPEKVMLPVVNHIQPAAGIFTNAVDMAKWMKFHISGGKDGAGRQLIPESIVRETHSAVMATSQGGISRDDFPVANLIFDYALAWWTGVYNGHSKIYHSGEYSSYSASLTILPEMELGVWVGITGSGTGSGGDFRDIVTMYAMDMLLDEAPWLNETTACSYPAPWRKHNRKVRSPPMKDINGDAADVDVNDYVGDYVHPAFGVFKVTLDGSQLKYTFGLLLRGDLNPKAHDQFLQTLDFPFTWRMESNPENYRGYPIYFERNGNDVTAIKVPYLEFDEPPVFTKM